jgi:hypothetical protein
VSRFVSKSGQLLTPRQDVESSITKHPARSTLIATGFLTFLVVVIGSALVLNFEEVAPHPAIITGKDALWWAVVTVATRSQHAYGRCGRDQTVDAAARPDILRSMLPVETILGFNGKSPLSGSICN